ncbi:MAG TPA: heme exporter protein CcmB [Chloroflexota bacterium]|nr:heme exporter protein CcmB [Chloroflexota bacterium]
MQLTSTLAAPAREGRGAHASAHTNGVPRLPDALAQIRALVAKDLLAEWRGRDVVASTGVFALLVLVIFAFAFDLRAESALLVTPGALWVAFAFATTLALGRTMALEAERGTLEGLLLCPASAGTIFFAKLLTNLVFTTALEVVLLPVFAIFFNAPVLHPALFLVVALGTLGLVGTGTLLAAIAAGTRAREILLPVLLFPISVPVLIAAVKATAAVLDAAGSPASGSGLAGVLPWLQLLAGYDVLFAAAGYLAFEYVVEQ